MSTKSTANIMLIRELTKPSSASSVDRLSQSLISYTGDLNPY
jgi:hypothetical protein